MKKIIILPIYILLLGSSQNPSFKESYGISIPTSIDLSASGSFDIGMSQGNLSDNQTIVITTDNSFVLSDVHGKPDNNGSILNSEVSFTSSDTMPKAIYYEVNDAGAGDWRGNLNINIELVTQTNENIFMDGPSIQRKLNRLRPTKIIFSHDQNISGTYTYDLSMDGDQSILLYKNGTEITITNMRNEKFKANPNMSSFFKNLNSLSTVENLDYIDMSTCTNMSYMFYYCYNLQNIDVSSFDVSNVTDMSYAFASLSNCTSIGNLSNWNVSNVETFNSFLANDYKLSNFGDISNWQVSNHCTNIASMFANCCYTAGIANSSSFPASLDLRNWNVSNITDMSLAFKNCFNLTTIDISTWSCTNATNMNEMFMMQDSANTSLLNNIIGVDNLNVSNASKVDLFTGCNNLNKPAWYQ